MALPKKEIAANIGGQLASVLVNFLTVPFIIRYLGPEAYGLVGFFMSLQAVTAIFDFGLSTAANREISRTLASSSDKQKTWAMIRTMELFYVAGGAILFCILWSICDWMAREWLRADKLSPTDIRFCLIAAAGTLGLRWPISLYGGVLRGLEAQVQLNTWFVFFVVARGVGSVLVMAFISTDVRAYFLYQLLLGGLETLVMSWVSWGRVGRDGLWKSRFEWNVLRGVWKYAFNIGWVSLFAVALKQVDKMVVSKLLPLDQLGVYTTATVASMGLAKIGTPIQSAVFPRLTRLFTVADWPGLSKTFHESVQLISFLSCPLCCIMIFFAPEVLLAWTHNEAMARNGAATMALMSVAMFFNLTMSIPFVLQLAAGLTWLPLYTNAIGAIALVPLTYYMVAKFGVVGGASAWLVFNVCYFLLVPQVLFRHILKGETKAFYLRDTLPFMALSALIFVVARYFAPEQKGFMPALIYAALGGVVYGVLAFKVSPSLREVLKTLPGPWSARQRASRVKPTIPGTL